MPYANPFLAGLLAARCRCAAVSALLVIFHLFSPLSLCAAGEAPFILPPQQELNKIKTAVVYTNKGDLRFELYPEEAPWHVANFKYRADKGLYRNTVFQIFYPGYILQGGGPRSNPAASASYQIPAEFNRHLHNFGTLGMARLSDQVNPGRVSSGNQFHILLGEAPHMNGTFTIFGHIVSGESVLETLQQGDVIKDIRVFVRDN